MITTKKGMVDKSKVTLDARWGVNTVVFQNMIS